MAITHAGAIETFLGPASSELQNWRGFAPRKAHYKAAVSGNSLPGGCSISWMPGRE
jgi:hypothetical protein